MMSIQYSVEIDIGSMSTASPKIAAYFTLTSLNAPHQEAPPHDYYVPGGRRP